MEESIEFKIPKFLEDATEEHFTELALSVAPPKIDTSEGQMYFDHTKSSAMIGAEITQFHMPIALQMMFPQFATGIYLEWHGAPYRIFRRGATRATEIVKVESKKEGQEIPKGVIVYTLGDDTESAKEYRTTENAIIENGSALIPIEAVEKGAIGNTAAQTIVGAQSGYEIDSVINYQPVTGGFEAENDESLRGRILSRIALAPLSGARRDYERWAKEVDGVGDVIVQPLWAGPQTVRVLITDNSNEIANEDLIRRVKEYIDPTEFEGLGEGQAPIGAIVTIDTIELMSVEVSAHIYFEEDADPTMTIERLKDNINQSWRNTSVIRISEVGAIFIKTEGILDYRDLTLNGQVNNIELTESQRAVVGEVVNNGS